MGGLLRGGGGGGGFHHLLHDHIYDAVSAGSLLLTLLDPRTSGPDYQNAGTHVQHQDRGGWIFTLLQLPQHLFPPAHRRQLQPARQTEILKIVLTNQKERAQQDSAGPVPVGCDESGEGAWRRVPATVRPLRIRILVLRAAAAADETWRRRRTRRRRGIQM